MKEKWIEFYEMAHDLGYDEDQAAAMADSQLQDMLASKADDYRQQQKEQL